ncbi:MAG TPA: chromosomal replication initiator protein DnaA [Actinomycetota bacterium]|nr:chromosomal replication initiator protein DnaA [Actinomycetota bacterium]
MPATTAQDVWQECLTVVRDRLSTAASRAWFEETHPLTMTDSVITLRAPHRFAKEWLEQRYSGVLQDAVSRAAGRPLHIEIVTPAGGVAVQAPAPLPAPVVQREPEAAPELSPQYSFENFVIGASNRFAHAAALAVAEAPASAYNPLFVYGGAGLGKTHLMHAIGRHTKQLYPHLKVEYVSSEKFMNDFINAIKSDRRLAFQQRYRESDLLLIDDIQFLENKETTQEEFFHTFNALHNANRQIVISSDRPPKKMATLEDRLRSRFEWGLITDIQPPDLETRVAILRRKAEDKRLSVPEDVLDYIASGVEDSVRELEGALIRVIAYASLNGTQVTVQLAEEVLSHLFPSSGAEPVRVDTIMAETAAYFGLGVDDLRSQNRSKSLVHARQIAMYLVRELTDLSLPKVGEMFGGRDHTTVLHAVKKIAAVIGEKRLVYHQIQDLTTRIKRRSGT